MSESKERTPSIGRRRAPERACSSGPVAKRMAGKRILVVADGALQYPPFAALPVPGAEMSLVPMVVGARDRQPAVGIRPGRAAARDEGAEATRQGGRRAGRSGLRARRSPAAHRGRRRPAIRRARFPPTRRDPPGSGRHPRDGGQGHDAAGDRLRGQPGHRPEPRAGPVPNRALRDTRRLRQRDPGLSAIILSMLDARGQRQDGFLRLHDIYGLRLPAELVVLERLQHGARQAGEGRGARRDRPGASCTREPSGWWPASGRSTTRPPRELMSRFYLEMLRDNHSPAAALRQAQLAVWRQNRWRPPFYWAAFVLQGVEMTGPTPRPRTLLTEASWDALLDFLDPDRAARRGPDRDREAELKYLEVVRKLVFFFAGRGCADAEDLALESRHAGGREMRGCRRLRLQRANRPLLRRGPQRPPRMAGDPLRESTKREAFGHELARLGISTLRPGPGRNPCTAAWSCAWRS
ncbi:MAG: CHAT domain-containing protein [Desulfomicrobium escambiense]|nr:CHAT domain-containing protein [Desulfomicrobium escambiense]